MVKAPGKASERSIKISKGIIFTFLTFYLIFYGIVISLFIEYFSIEAIPVRQNKIDAKMIMLSRSNVKKRLIR